MGRWVFFTFSGSSPVGLVHLYGENFRSVCCSVAKRLDTKVSTTLFLDLHTQGSSKVGISAGGKRQMQGKKPQRLSETGARRIDTADVVF